MIRLVRGYSLKDVAGRSGLSAGYIQKIERGEIKEPSPHRLRRIAGALDYSYPQLLVLAGYVDDDAAGSSTLKSRASVSSATQSAGPGSTTPRPDSSRRRSPPTASYALPVPSLRRTSCSQ